MNIEVEKKAIHTIIDELEGKEAILRVKQFLEELNSKSKVNINLSKNYDKIAKQYNKTLEKLAQ